MSCPDIEKIAQDEPDEATAAHVAGCASCRERREKLARLLAFPAATEPPPDVLPRLLARIEAPPVRQVARRPLRFARPRRLAAAVFAAALLVSSSIVLFGRSEAEAKERRLETIVVESEWRALGYSSEQEFLADGGAK